MSETEESLPKYLRIAEDIRGRIERGELGVGAEVESERELAVRWAVARPTAAKALNTLRQSGMVESRRGSGTYVAHRRPVVVRDDGPVRWRRAGDGHEVDGSGGSVRSITVVAAALVEMPAAVADVFGFAGTAVMRTVAITSAGTTELRTSWYPGEFGALASRLLETRPIEGGVRRYVETASGRIEARRYERVCARTVSEIERTHLGVESDAPVLVRQTVRYDDADTVLCIAETVYPPGRWVLERHDRPDR
ncbi:GntR family transcriptional regulator [Nocardia cyriacigeorgica]|uniref:GntR family transcriptional regulator n=1 Tax=Nocardia cyriacigeorgica TaxID=135487 RepID=UPI002455450A|nr:GntR family transcriptional regulator [Nocardia cyriacigeorgica]